MPRLTPELLLCAYASGLFPMANDRHDPTIHWIEPRRRGILPLHDFHMSRSLKKAIRREHFQVRVNHDFAGVIEACAAPTSARPRTWLNDELIGLYIDLHRLGYAHSIETWREDRLVGGLYGVSVGAVFFGESRFTVETGAGKIALVSLVERLVAGGYSLLDVQFVTDHLRRFGAIEVSRETYRRSLREALSSSAVFYSDGGAVPSVPPWAPAGTSIGSRQSSTQRS